MIIIQHKTARGEWVDLSFKKGSPFQKKQGFLITATLPAKDKMLANAEKRTMVLYDTTFGDAIQKAQRRWPGASITLKTM